MSTEIESLQAQIEALKTKLSEARRRAQQEPVKDYTLSDVDGAPVKLSELFGGRRDLIVIHNMGRSCRYCTLWADGLNGLRLPLTDRAAFVLASPDRPAVLQEFAASRGWGFRTVSTAGSGFSKDLGFEKDGKPQPGASGFRRLDDGSIVRTGHASFGPGDDFCAAWPLFDLLQDGAGDWKPKYDYA